MDADISAPYSAYLDRQQSLSRPTKLVKTGYPSLSFFFYSLLILTIQVTDLILCSPLLLFQGYFGRFSVGHSSEFNLCTISLLSLRHTQLFKNSGGKWVVCKGTEVCSDDSKDLVL